MKLRMELGERSYDIIVKRGSLSKASQLANFNRKVMIISDNGVPEQYIKALHEQCAEAYTMVFEQGEATKSMDNWQKILTRMMELSFGRGDAVAAVGGGVVGDLAGFAAASYMRGVDYFQFPTTTLSQIDSSIGGKVAVNLGHTKNIVGAFHQPKLVVADPDTLKTLSPRHYSNGLAEALKTGLIGSSALLDLMEDETSIDENIEQVLYYSLRYKKGVVERDEKEQGERKLLNFGHTIGHGIEAATAESSEPLLHGECVALGMLPMIETRMLQRRTISIMKKLNLPLSYKADPDTIMSYIKSDKKRHGGLITVVKVKTPGLGYLEDVPMQELELMVAGSNKEGV